MTIPLTDNDQILGRQRALDIGRGVGRLLNAHGLASIVEFSLANGRRADVAGVAASGDIWIVEIKSCAADFAGDQKWPEYREFCDRFYFAVAPDFPTAMLPPDTGLIIADRYGGDILREAPVHKIAAARRKAMTLRLFRAAAFRLQGTGDQGVGEPKVADAKDPAEAGPCAGIAGVPPTSRLP